MQWNPFLLFDVEPSPAVSIAVIDEKFEREVRGGQAVSPEFSRAREELISPSRRLKWLLSWKGADSGADSFPPDLMDDFAAVNALLQQAAPLGKELKAASTELARVVKLPAARKLQRALEEVRGGLDRKLEEAEAELREIAEGDWQAFLTRLGEIRLRCGFWEKWSAQMRSAWADLVV